MAISGQQSGASGRTEVSVHDQLLGAIQPVLSITLQPGETIVAGPGEFAWMSDSIQMSADPAALPAPVNQTLAESSLRLAAYTATEAAGTIAFAARLPGGIVGVEVGPGREYLVDQHGFLAATPGVLVTAGHRQPCDSAAGTSEFCSLRISGRGRAWIELSGDVVRRELAPGTSLRTHPWHIGMFEASVAVQLATLPGVGTDPLGHEVSRFAVVSGPGAVWLQSMAQQSVVRNQPAKRSTI